MSQQDNLIEGLKQVLKTKGMTYAALARELRLSEASVKRIFAEKSFTLSRLDEICNLLGISFSQLAKMAEGRRDVENTLTNEQEEALAKNPDLLTLFYLFLEGLSVAQLRREYSFSPKEEIALLRELDRLKLIELHGQDRVRVKVTRLVRWNLDGPLMALYRKQLREEFFDSKFNRENEMVRLIPGKLSSHSFARLRQKIHRLLEEYNEMVEVDGEIEGAQTVDLGLIVAYRPWRFSLIERRRGKRKLD